MIGCLRILQRWTLEAACDEYTRYTFHKQRFVDKQFIERFDPRLLAPYTVPRAQLAPWLPSDYTEGCSALEAAIRLGVLLPEQAGEGLSVPAIDDTHPEEPGTLCPPQALQPPQSPGLQGAACSCGAGAGEGAGAQSRARCAVCSAGGCLEGAAGAAAAQPMPCACASPLAESLRQPLSLTPLDGGLTMIVFTRSSGSGSGSGSAGGRGAEGEEGAGGGVLGGAGNVPPQGIPLRVLPHVLTGAQGGGGVTSM